jgi:periplasmic divalent cation tolerance protein
MSSDLSRYVMVITTCADDEQATQLATALVDKKLAACVQASNITSTYRWKGAVETAGEVRLLIKARYSDYRAIEALIKSTHSYETPEILAVPVITGSAAYLEWIDTETRR